MVHNSTLTTHVSLPHTGSYKSRQVTGRRSDLEDSGVVSGSCKRINRHPRRFRLHPQLSKHPPQKKNSRVYSKASDPIVQEQTKLSAQYLAQHQLLPMAAHVSPANSPMGDFDILLSDDESWAFIGTPIAGSLSEPSIAFLPSPASRSLASYGVVARSGHRYRGPSPSFSSLSMSPVPLQMVPNSSPPPPTSAPSPDLLSARSHRQPTSYPVQFTDAMASSMASSMNVTGILTDSQFTMSQSNISADTSGIMSPPSCYLIDQNYDGESIHMRYPAWFPSFPII